MFVSLFGIPSLRVQSCKRMLVDLRNYTEHKVQSQSEQAFGQAKIAESKSLSLYNLET